MVDLEIPYTIVTVHYAVHGPWCNRRIGPGQYLVQGDARRFFRNVADVKLLAYGYVELTVVDPAVTPAVTLVVEEPTEDALQIPVETLTTEEVPETAQDTEDVSEESLVTVEPTTTVDLATHDTSDDQ